MNRLHGVIFLGIGGLLITLAVRYSLHLSQERAANRAELASALHRMAAPTPRDRILIVAPHCDDETLACGGLIARALKARSHVAVVLGTSGDGFTYAVERFFGEPEVRPKDYLTMATERQAESLAAVSVLGLEPTAVTFLGYPDGGTGRMWLEHWDSAHPYTSPHTRDDHNPYPNALTPGAPYCARSVIDDMKKVIATFKPTVIFCPHPNDEHPDHWALNCYTLAALHELGQVDRVRTRLYLVHRGEHHDWPAPSGLHLSQRMTPPADLAHLTTRWQSLPLSPAVARQKERAITRYRSQMMVMRDFMLSFARSTEMFGELGYGRLPVVAPGRIAVDGRVDDWEGLRAAIVDPTQDLSPVDAIPQADLVKAYVARDARRLYVRIDAYEPISPDVYYEVRLNVLAPGNVEPPVSYVLHPGHQAPGVVFRASGSHLEMSAPWPGPSATDGLLLSADTRFGHHIFDKTAWMLLRP
jgi:LmbE family N-acetylglucosaminyl deacetylase